MLIPTLVVWLLLYLDAQLQGLLLLATRQIGMADGVDPEPEVPTLFI